jgi:flagellin
MVIQHNMTAMNANRNLGVTTGSLAKSTEKLSSGYKINRAGDNAAGLAISEKMRGQIRGLDQASSNAEDGISLIQTAEGALTETHSIIQRMRELAVQSASDTNTDDDRTQIQNEIDQLTQEVDRIANTTEFNTKKLLNGDRTGAVNQKEGTNKIEGTFTNSLVKVDTTSDDLKTAFNTDVIRIELNKDADSEGKVGAAASGYTVKSLHGASTGVTVTSEGINVDKALLRKVSDGKILTDVASVVVVVKISNATKMKAGDVITITLGEAVTTQSATTGKDALRLQIGANAGQEVKLGINAMTTQALDISDKTTGEALDVSTQTGASMAVEAYDMAIQKVSTERAKLGATQNRLEHTIANLDTSSENLQSAESSLRDTDMAEEMTKYSKNNILMQAGQSMLAQANQSTQGVLNLLG